MIRRLSLWLSWLLASAAGGAFIGSMAAPTDFFWFLVMTGLVIGVAQWLVLRRYLPGAGWWILASAFGWFLGSLVLMTTVEIINPIADFLESVIRLGIWGSAVTMILYGTVLGAVQWLVLRRHTQRAGWWVLASVIGGAVGGAVGAACSEIPFGSAALTYGVAWAGSGAVTGMVLVWLL